MYKLFKLTRSNRFADYLKRYVSQDKSTKPFLQSDLAYLGNITPKEEKEIAQRLEIFFTRLASKASNWKMARRAFSNEIFIPETYFKFARSFAFRKSGPLPNHVTEHLHKRGYTDQDLKECIGLAAIPAVCMTDDEFQRVKKFRLECPVPEVGFRIMRVEDRDRYLTGEFHSICGFWTDHMHYDGAASDKLIYDLLRLDYPKSDYRAHEKKFYAIRFALKHAPLKGQIPFMNRIKINEYGEISSHNTPGNPLTANGFTATREPLLVPEYKATAFQPIPLIEEQTCLGYLDKHGKFHEEFMFYKGKWIIKKQYEKQKESEKSISVLKVRISDPPKRPHENSLVMDR
ncbi:hypothetical protein [Shimazuella alba]|uniref:Uncharacterized protein n=1 Tax=Shimazuella alba TaxID=2690964 RepID=A0A6I4W026_9BACL|nr:hypothetical protein [Shimazuella alba]MXQ55316.1 hypothetical protein [Shimazuella alba]